MASLPRLPPTNYSTYQEDAKYYRESELAASFQLPAEKDSERARGAHTNCERHGLNPGCLNVEIRKDLDFEV